MAAGLAGSPGGPQGASEEPQGSLQAPRATKRASWLMVFILGACVGLALWPLIVSLLTLSLLRQWEDGGSAGPPVSPGNPLNNQQLSDDMSQEQPEPPPVKTQRFKPLRFSDLAGLSEAKQELQEVVECLRSPQKFRRLGARLPKGVLLVGPPGTGKTALARAVATEAGVPLLYASGSEFVEVFVGQGARRVRQLFASARQGAPLILFIDELDAVGGRRGPGGSSGGGREHEQTLNQLLVELDGFHNGGERVVVLAATNRVDALDPALLRPGRFDRIVHVSLPDRRARELILLKYISKVPVEAPKDEETDANTTIKKETKETNSKRKRGGETADAERHRDGDIRRRQGDSNDKHRDRTRHRQKHSAKHNILAPPAADKDRSTNSSKCSSSSKSSSKPSEIEEEGEGSVHKALASQLAKLTPGFSGAELENLVNEAAILAARADKTYISLAEFLEARDKVTLGPSRGSRLQSALQRRVTATHEAGHAVVAFFLQPHADPIHKATIVSRGNALGFVEQLPLEDRYGSSYSELFARLCVCMGGRAAEKLAFGAEAVSTGASSDIHTATQIAFKMVASWGMSKQMGPLAYTAAARQSFISSETARQIEIEVKTLVEQAEAKAEALLRRHWRSVSLIADLLLERETLSGEEIAAVIDPRGKWQRKVEKQRLAKLQQAERKRFAWWSLWGGPGAWLQALWQQVQRALKGDRSSGPPGGPKGGPPKGPSGGPKGELPGSSDKKDKGPLTDNGGKRLIRSKKTDTTAATAELQQEAVNQDTQDSCSNCSTSTRSSSSMSSDRHTPETLWGPVKLNAFAAGNSSVQKRLLQQQHTSSSSTSRTKGTLASLPEEPLSGGLGPQLLEWRQQKQQLQQQELFEQEFLHEFQQHQEKLLQQQEQENSQQQPGVSPPRQLMLPLDL